MARTLRRWFASLILSGILCSPVAAQEENDAIKGRRPPVPEAVVAFLVTVILLAVVCVPSRRS